LSRAGSAGTVSPDATRMPPERPLPTPSMDPKLTRTPPAELYSEARLMDNLGVLAQLDPELAERLTWPVDDSRVLFTAAGEMRYLAHREAHSLGVGADLLELESQSPLLLGLGDGDVLDQALARKECERITCWERDPWLLRLDLMRSDRRLALSSGRLRYCLGPDLLALRHWKGSVLRHPAMLEHYRLEFESFQRPASSRRALLCVGKLFYAQMAGALQAEGFELWSLDVERQAPEELQRTLQRFEPELILSINYTGGLAEFCEALGVPLVVWEVDPSLSQWPACNSSTENTWIWTYRQAHVPLYRGAGFAHVEYLPLAADPKVRRPLELQASQKERYGAPVSFVGNSMLSEVQDFRASFLGEHAIWRGIPGDDGEAAALFERLVSEQRTDPSRNLIPEALEREAPDFRAQALARPGQQDPVILVGEFCAAEKRLSHVNALVDFGIVAWGDRGWAQLAQTGIEYRGSAGHGEELTLIYNATAVNLDINRIYQPDIITMRVFDVLAAGGFLLAEHSEALAEAFEIDEELVSYRSLGELREKLAHYLAHPEEARRIAERGRARVLREHTIAARLKQMLEAAGLAAHCPSSGPG